jgi:hypothetical protein
VQVWLAAGWRVKAVDLSNNIVLFARWKPGIIEFGVPWRVTAWCRKFNCTEEQFRDAIDKVGNMTEVGVNYLGVQDILTVVALMK